MRFVLLFFRACQNFNANSCSAAPKGSSARAAVRGATTTNFSAL